MITDEMNAFIADLADLNENNDDSGSRRNERITVETVRSSAHEFGGRVVVEMMDYSSDRAILIALEESYPDTIRDIECVAIYLLADGFLAAFERGSFDKCFATAVEWTRVEIAEIC